jgi:hypothetical protein
MGVWAHGVMALTVLTAVGTGCAGRSQRIGDDGGAGGVSGAGGSSTASSGGTGGSSGNGLGGGAGKGAGGGSAGSSIAGVGNTSGGTAGSGGSAGSAGGVAGLSGAAGAPPLGEPEWLPQGSIQLSGYLYRRTLSALLGLPFTEEYPRQSLVLQAGVDPRMEGPSPQLSEIARAEVAAMSDAALLEALGCSDGSRGCAEVVADQFAPRAFRRPLDDVERAAILAVYDDTAEGTIPSPLRATVLSVLESSAAHWISAIGTRNELGEITLDDYEIASLMSYGLTGLPPDANLRSLASAGLLRASDNRRAEADRLLSLDEGLATYQAFVRDWFRVRDAKELWFYEAESALAESMLLETNRFIEVATYEDGAAVSELLSASWSMLDLNMIEHYGIEPITAAARVDISATRRRGILGHASFLASRSSAEQGGLIGRSVATLRLLCEDLPEPPLEVPPIPTPEPSSTYREALSQATASPGCRGCHAVLDPVAFSFGKFDGRGVFSELEGSIPIDSTGMVTTFDGVGFSFDDSADLAEQMAIHPKFAECFDRNVVAASTGANVRDEAVSDYVQRAAADDNVPSMIETVLRWAESEHFVRRTPCCAIAE